MVAMVMLTAFSFLALSFAASTPSEKAEQQVRKASEEEVQAFVHNDPETMDRLWSDELVVTNPLNRLVTKHDVLGMVKSGFLVITSYDRRIEYAHVYGDTVILAGSETVVWGGKMPIAGKPQLLRFTAIWMKRQGRWQQVARHANVVPSADRKANE